MASFFAQILRPLLSQPAVPATARPRTLHDVGGELDALADEAEARRREAIARDVANGAADGVAAVGVSEVALTEARRKVWKVERAKLQVRLEEEIVTLHADLGTGVQRELLPRLRRLVEAHGPSGGAAGRASAEQQIESSVLDALSRRIGEKAWRRLNDLMAKAAIAWPTPDGLDHGRSGDELAVAVAQHYEDVRRDFVNAPGARLAGWISGDVAAWAYSYPPPGSYLWRKTALCGVAAGLHAQLFAAALEVWMWRPPELEARLLSTFEEELRGARERLREWDSSALSTLDIASRVAELCRTVAPAMVWEYVEPRLSWEAPGPTVTDLAGGLAQVDPVCGMSLTADKVRERTELDGVIYYFCHPSCLDAFRSGPAPYVTA